MITLYTFGPAFGLPDPSPFVVKAEMLLKMAAVPYQTDTRGFPRAPKGKLPYLHDEGALIPDSTFIRLHLEEKHQFDFDHGLSKEQRGIAWAVEKLLEDNLYWTVVDARWMVDENFAKGPALFFRKIPWPMRPVLTKMIRGKIKRSLWGQGMGRHKRAEIELLAAKGIDAVAAVLGDKPYLMGEQPCGADATAFAFMQSGLCPHFDTPIRAAIERHANLVAYVERVKQRYYAPN
ncbi:MAG: glutathione S-transferase family protein [Burkholderiaceae bacterium]|nr:MAG: glutathione S-transferase family protein [Burkholderiaceae bacterium]